MTNTRINASLNTAKEIINALMNSEEIFYDRTEGNELSGRFVDGHLGRWSYFM